MTTDLDDRRHVLVSKGVTATLDDILQFWERHLIILHKFLNHLDGKFPIFERSPLLQFLCTYCGHSVRHKETSIVRQARHDDCAEIQVFLTAAGGTVRDRCHDANVREVYSGKRGCNLQATL